MQYENDGLRVTFAGTWPGDQGYDYLVPEPMGVVDVSAALAKGAAGSELGYAISVYFLPEAHRLVKEWGRTDVRHVLAYLKPIVDARVQLVIANAEGPVVSKSELPHHVQHWVDGEDGVDDEIDAEEPEWFKRLTEIRDAVRVQFTPGDYLVLRVNDHYTPNQWHELQNALQAWLDQDGDLGVRVLVVPGEALSILELPEPYIDPGRPQEKRTRVGSTWVVGHVSEEQARVQVATLHQEQLDLAKLGLKESKTAPVEWWEHGERLAEPPAEVA